MSHVVHYAVLCQAGFGNVVGVPTFGQMTGSGTTVRAGQLVVARTEWGPATGRLAVGNPRGPWRITENLVIPSGVGHVVGLQRTDEVASLILHPDAQSPVTLSILMSVESPQTVGAAHYPIRNFDSFAVSFGQSFTRPRLFLCCDFGPLEGLEIAVLDASGNVISRVDGPWPTGRTFLALPQLAAGASVLYKSPREELAPPASLVLEWLAPAL
jgi:hypothetical protein